MRAANNPVLRDLLPRRRMGPYQKGKIAKNS